mmetsp:Transcript_9483/g.14390  ORF Transcript_9483/g.14390 Transcript_9483/m.14390 type:complete len:170 (-) Transcript_9483:69-578(-)|eukprot:CAMPEP_0201507566 /NCGR_PEP_ID=MMETSP0161_2-20130828/1209_1 /ASSEMBLY_ACC=CAM_ASM_000251 /TAXON_ID=180227 /ORGANISM="Neoparamoeba aestuarina, Strain SoJaBio B1-5/56/2" /LENGTH=169 /DNA_ID=CAMNT_0047901975 /DNA_START=50 /DNA_END=559 /DNA_ORIENTATION=-
MSLMPKPQKIYELFLAIRQKGLVGSFQSLYYYNTIRYGQLVGTDDQGNKYYENDEYYTGRNRWVEYADMKNYDGSMVDASWFPWLHNQVYHPPTHPDVQKMKPFWLAPHKRNLTGTAQAYFPPGHFFNPDRDLTTKQQKFIGADPSQAPLTLEERMKAEEEMEEVTVKV